MTMQNSKNFTALETRNSALLPKITVTIAKRKLSNQRKVPSLHPRSQQQFSRKRLRIHQTLKRKRRNLKQLNLW